MTDHTTKIVLLPLDERPCNARFPVSLFAKEGVEIVVPEALGDKKQAASHEALTKSLRRTCRDADGLVLSLDMLLYGGLIPSRIHALTAQELERRLDFVRELRTAFPDMLIYAFQCVMRCPDYSSSDEEPDYYAEFGAQIHRAGEALHKEQAGLLPAGSAASAASEVDTEVLEDYTARRALNRRMNEMALELVDEGIIDFMVIPQDDSAPYSYAAMDQHAVRAAMKQRGVGLKAVMYPGADEVGLTLISRMLLTKAGQKPKVYVRYAAEQARSLIPRYESCKLESTVHSHILTAGCELTASQSEADIILAVTAPAFEMEESIHQPSMAPGYTSARNLPNLVDYLLEQKENGKIIAICDNAYCNGGELELAALLDSRGMLEHLDSYAGWNTSANTLGTALAQAVDSWLFGRTASHMDFVIGRLIEDIGYCSVVRSAVTRRLPEAGFNYFDAGEKEGLAARWVHQDLESFVQEYLPSIAGRVRICQVSLPWKRMFEVDLSVQYRPAKESAFA